MPEPFVSATFKKTVSDGNYGGETCEISVGYSLETDDQQAASEIADSLARNVRALVHAELSRSPSLRVRQALMPPRPRTQEDEAASWAWSNANSEERAIVDADDVPL